VLVIAIILLCGTSSSLVITEKIISNHAKDGKYIGLEKIIYFLQEWKEKEKKGVNLQEINNALQVLKDWQQTLSSKMYHFPFSNNASKVKKVLSEIESEITWLEWSKKQMLQDIKDEFVDTLIPPFRRTKDFNVDSPCINITRKKIFDKNMQISRSKEKIYSPSLQSGIDIEAHDLYLSRVPEDKNKNSVVVNPHAGDKLYIHWVYTIKGEGVVPSFHWRLRLVTDNDQQIINLKEQETHKEAGYKYILYFENPWVAPGGKYNLSLEVDTDDEVEETNEDNNFIIKSFSVTPIDEKFDLELNDIWMSSKPGDTKKEHTLGSDIWEGTEVYFHVKWTIWGNPNTIIPPYDLRMAEGSDDLPPEINVVETIQEERYRRTGYIYIAWLQTEEGDGWIANTPGFHYLAAEVDSKKKIKEWNENNNFLSLGFKVYSNTVQPNKGDTLTRRGGFFSWLVDVEAYVHSEECKGQSFVKTFFFSKGNAVSFLFYNTKYAGEYACEAYIYFSGDYEGYIAYRPPFSDAIFLIDWFIIDVTDNMEWKNEIFSGHDAGYYRGNYYSVCEDYTFYPNHIYEIGVLLEAAASSSLSYISTSDFRTGGAGWHLYTISFEWR